MKYAQWLKRDPVRNCFLLPNEIFLLGLSPGALAVYSYLLCCENRQTYQCWPSYKTIGRAVRMSANTVRKYVCELEERQLISTENTSVTTKAGLKRNGNLLYTIRPIQLALDQFYEQQLAQMDVAADRHRVATTLALRSDSAHSV
ncbi:helix-turn-helix domain-containing protein [uncultured Oscillibacter sp.]|uniref:helix-turn-helix domain-containing protein n=1 Tax=uncultured Oscillibacter sp. TaxID=876091 RepID=UPI002638EEB6|nr:helix-turn-helix domain-containing protein [uncultured Oscillibacter sp.]